MEKHQQALVDQSIRRILTCYEHAHGLLRSPTDPRSGAVQESLAFAALLLTRTAAGKGRNSELGLARLLIDTLLPLQNRHRRDPGRGAFPLVRAPEDTRPQTMDVSSRAIMGSMLALLLKEHSSLLGEKRCVRIREAVKHCIRGSRSHGAGDTSDAMILAWLEFEFGDTIRGERLATEVSLMGGEQRSSHRFGNPRAYALELWGLSLWNRSSALHAGVQDMLISLREEVSRYAHPDLPEVFGGMTAGSCSSAGEFAWLGCWLSWHARGGRPLLPKHMADPLQPTLFAFPALAKFKLGDAVPGAGTDGRLERSFVTGERHDIISGWWENDLHLEARSSRVSPPDRAPVAGARWRTPSGTTAWLRCSVTGRERAVCRKRFIHLEEPGTTIITVHDLGSGDVRMIDNGWWLSGLHFASDGLQMTDAERTPDGLKLRLKPTESRPMLLLAPLN